MVGNILQARPEDVDGWVYYGSLLEKRGYDEAAAAAYRAAVKLLPNTGMLGEGSEKYSRNLGILQALTRFLSSQTIRSLFTTFLLSSEVMPI